MFGGHSVSVLFLCLRENTDFRQSPVQRDCSGVILSISGSTLLYERLHPPSLGASLMLSAMLVTVEYLARLGAIANRFTVRIHAGLVQKYQSWTKLWYFLRGVDTSSAGYGSIQLSDISYWLGASESTVYQWLREGKEAGAFRFYAIRRGILTVALGSLKEVSFTRKFFKRRSWGTVASIPLVQLYRLRQHATAAEVQHMQSQSHFAARAALEPDERKVLRIPKPSAFFAGSSEPEASQNRSGRALLPPSCLHIDRRFIWVSRGFVPLGTCQRSIAKIRGFCDRTIRNHLSALEVERRQIVQSKGAYRHIVKGIEEETVYLNLHPGSVDEYTLLGYIPGYLPYDDPPEMKRQLIDRNGITFTLAEPNGASANFKPIKVNRKRFFQDKSGRWWQYRCNLYDLDYQLHSTQVSRDCYLSIAEKRARAAQDELRRHREHLERILQTSEPRQGAVPLGNQVILEYYKRVKNIVSTQPPTTALKTPSG